MITETWGQIFRCRNRCSWRLLADSATVTSIVEEIDGDIYLAMDNCPHQSVLVGNKAAAEQAIEQLRRRGIIYEILPFDRPYHTPMFQAYAEALAARFSAPSGIGAEDPALFVHHGGALSVRSRRDPKAVCRSLGASGIIHRYSQTDV